MVIESQDGAARGVPGQPPRRVGRLNGRLYLVAAAWPGRVGFVQQRFGRLELAFIPQGHILLVERWGRDVPPHRSDARTKPVSSGTVALVAGLTTPLILEPAGAVEGTFFARN